MNSTDDDTEDAAMATADEWFESFTHSPTFARLTESQQRNAGAITEYFARYMQERREFVRPFRDCWRWIA